MKNKDLAKLLKNTPLTPEQEGIISYLRTRKEGGLDIKDISKYFNNPDSGYEPLSPKQVRGELIELKQLGFVRSKTEENEDGRKDFFYLTGPVRGGTTKRRYVQGRGVFSSIDSFINRYKKPTGAFFMLLGLGVFIYEGLGMTGAIVSSGAKITPTFILGFVLFFVGIALLEKSFGEGKK